MTDSAGTTTRERLDALREAIEADAPSSMTDALIGELHPADLAELIDELDPERRVMLFRRIPLEMRAETLSEVAPEAWPMLLDSIEPQELRALFESLEVDDAADILARLPQEYAREILAKIEPEGRREIAALMAYDAESAGGIMTTELVSVPAHITCDEAILWVRQRGREVQDFHTVYVVDDENRLLGTLSLRDLILADGQSPVLDIMDTDIVRVRPTVDQEEVARLIAKYNLISIPVCDEFDHLLGRITVDDVIDIIEAETTEDIFRLSGVGEEEEEAYASPFEIVRSRAPWLLITLGTSGLGALVVAQFESTIQRLSFIAVFMPVVAAMAGNSAIQATTVAVRRLALARGGSPARSLPRELVAGLVMGGLIALILGLAAGVWQRSEVGFVVGGSMWAAISVGVLWGAAFPILLDRVGLDPAVSSSVFLTTMTDLISFLLILGSASYFLSRLL